MFYLIFPKALKEKQEKLLAPVRPLRFLQKVERPVPRPPTPSVGIPDEVGILFNKEF